MMDEWLLAVQTGMSMVGLESFRSLARSGQVCEM